MNDRSPAPLQGVKVLDLTRVLAGPWATQLLADLGADVVKVERRGEGDDSRHWGPPYFEGADGERAAAFFLSCNRGKRSIEIDFGSADEAAVVRALAAECDVVVENFKVGGLAKYGLDATTLRARHPRLIYCSITGFGQTGPYAERPGYDFVVQGLGGLMSVTGAPDEMPGGGPMKVGVAVVDIMTGLYAANAIMAALIERGRTGKGRAIDLALLDVQVATLANQALAYLATGESPGRLGNAIPSVVPYEVFATADGHIIVAAGNDGQFRKLSGVLGLDALVADPRFITNGARVAHRTELAPFLSAAFALESSATWLDRLEAAGVPVAPINRIAEVFDDPQIVHRAMRIEREHPEMGVIPGVACPIRFDGIPLASAMPPPRIGEHREAIVADWLG